jgi:hypothetical protein
MNGAAASTPRRVRRIANLTLAIVGATLLFAAFIAGDLQQRSALTGEGAPWLELFEYELAIAILWALFAPLAIKAAQALRIRKGGRTRNGAAMLLPLPLPLTRTALLQALRLWWHGDLAVLIILASVTYAIEARREAAAQQARAASMRALLARVELDALRRKLQPHVVSPRSTPSRACCRPTPLARTR